MANIEKRITSDGGQHWRVRVRIKGYAPAYATFAKRADARDWAAQVEADMRAQRYDDGALARKYTVADMVDRYEERVFDTSKKKPRSVKLQRRQLAWWKKAIGEYALANVTPVLLAEQRDKLAKEGRRRRGPATIVGYFAILGHAFNTAKDEWGWVKTNPVTDVEKPQLPVGRSRALSEDELKRLLRACKGERKPILLITVLALSTGARKNELLGLKKEHIRDDYQWAEVGDTKSRKPTLLQFIEPARSMLKEHVLRHRIRRGYLFPSPAGDAPMNIDREFRRVVRAAGIRDYHFHDNRHTHASYLVMNGMDSTAVQGQLNHSDIKMTSRYTHWSKVQLAGKVTKIITPIIQKGADHANQ